MKFKKILSLSVVTSLLLTSGCTLETSREIQADVVDSTEGQEIEGLKDGGYYVKHDSKLYKVSDPNKTFETGNVVNNPDSERIIYFTDKKVDGEYTNEDWDKIPTLYEGDSLIYYYTDVLSETYNFERFEDVGYTIGIYNLNETVSGRYSFELESDYINDSDANKVSVLPTESAIIDKVSQKELRKGNISNYGTIIGLKQDKLYPFEIYAGTVLNKINIKADTRILGSMQVYESNDYEFLSSNIVKVNIPEWFNSGYYMINGLGLFRYVVGSSYDESTNFNVPNEEGDGIIEESTEEMEFESTEMTDYENTGTNENEEQYEKLEIEDDETAEFEIKSDGDKRVVIQENDELFAYRKGVMFEHIVNNPRPGEESCDLEHLGKMALVAGANVFIIGETKGAEICSAITLANSGCRTATTIHAESAEETPEKMADLAMRGFAKSTDQAKRMIKAFNIIVYMQDFAVQEIEEIIGYDADKKELIFRCIYRKEQ